MDFIKDLEKIAKLFLDSFLVKYDTSLTTEDILELYVNVQLKLIKPQPRKVFRSKKLKNASLDKHTIEVLDKIESKSINGENLNPHLSKGLIKGKFTDLLFSDWKIYHFHLNTEIENNYFVKRSKNVLFCYIDNDAIYFVDIRPHGKNGERHVFAQKEILEIIYEEWSWILEPYRLKGVIDVEQVIDDPKEIQKMRTAGVNIIHKVKDGIFAPMGGGITTAVTSVNTRIEADRLIRMAREAEKYIDSNFDTIEDNLMKTGQYQKGSSKFSLDLNDNGFYVVEENTKYIIPIK